MTTDRDGYKAIAYDRFSAVLLEAIKVQQSKIEAQNDRLELLEEALVKEQSREIAALKEEVARLKTAE